jgi:hypothetical protein
MGLPSGPDDMPAILDDAWKLAEHFAADCKTYSERCRQKAVLNSEVPALEAELVELRQRAADTNPEKLGSTPLASFATVADLVRALGQKQPLNTVADLAYALQGIVHATSAGVECLTPEQDAVNHVESSLRLMHGTAIEYLVRTADPEIGKYAAELGRRIDQAKQTLAEARDLAALPNRIARLRAEADRQGSASTAKRQLLVALRRQPEVPAALAAVERQQAELGRLESEFRETLQSQLIPENMRWSTH